MGMTDRIGPAITITGTTLLVSCGGGHAGGSCGSFGSYGSYGSYGSCGPLLPGPDGIYEGGVTSMPSSQGPNVAIVAENGAGRISTPDGNYYRLNVSPSGNTLGGSYTRYLQPASGAGTAQPQSGSVTGLLTPAGLSLTLADPSGSRSLALTFDDVYRSGSSLANLAGNWTATTANGLTITATIQPDGSFSAADSNNCTYAGSFSLIDPTFDVYAETHVRSCNGAGLTFTGLAAVFPKNAGSTRTTELELLTDDNASDYLVADFQ